ncbi:MAG: hypothetical protein PHN75_19630 [Syntrophales bacterium]|nr:hypothetical protein [Syntrophales bacterium]
MSGKTKKATFNLHTTVLDELNEAVSLGMAPSKNSLVEQALVKELKELRKRERKAQWQAAMKDPLFVRDINKTEYDFQHADAETAGEIE